MRRIVLLLLTLVSCAGAYLLRLFQCAGEPDAVPAFFLNIPGVCLWGMLALLALLLLILLFRIPRRGELRAALGCAAGLPFQWAGAVLLIVSGVIAALPFLSAPLSFDFCFALSVSAAALLLIPALTVRFHRGRSFVGVTALLSLLLFLFRLFWLARLTLLNDTLFAYSPLLLFHGLLSLMLVTLVSFSFGDRAERRLLFFASLSVAAAGAAFFGVSGFSDALFILGGAMLALGCFLSVLFSKASEPAPHYEKVDDPFGMFADEDDVFSPSFGEEGETAFDLNRVDRIFRELEGQDELTD